MKLLNPFHSSIFLRLILVIGLSCGQPGEARTIQVPKNFAECPVKFVRSGLVARNGDIWIAGEKSSIYRLSLGNTYGKVWDDMRYFNGMPDTDAFTCLAEDQKNRIWAGTDNQGVAVFNGEKWHVYDRTNALSGDHIYAISVAPKSGIVAIATSGGVVLYDPAKDQWDDLTRAQGLPEDQVESLAFDTEDKLWLAHSCSGVSYSSPQKNYRDWKTYQAKWYWDAAQTLRQPTKAKGNELPSNLCNVIMPAKDGSILTGTCAGLARLDNKNSWNYLRGSDYFAKNRDIYSFGKKIRPGVSENPDKLLPNDYITCLAETDQGYWVGTRNGAALLGKKNMNVIEKIQGNDKHPLPCKWLRSLMVLPNGTVLGGTYGKGLTVLSTRPKTIEFGTGEKEVAIPPLPSARPIPSEDELSRSLQLLAEKSSKSPQTPVFFVEEDWSTLGDWCYRYGNRRALLCATNAPVSDSHSQDSTFFRLRKAPPNNEGIEYIQDCLYDISRTIGPLRKPDDSVRSWIMTINEPHNRKILYNYMYAVRTKSDWDDHGEAYPPSADGPDIWLILVVPEGMSTASLHFYNKEGFNLPGDPQRDYLIEVKKYKPMTDLQLFPLPFALARQLGKQDIVEGEEHYVKDLDNMVKAPTLARCRVRDFISTPVYKTFALEGPATYCVRICRNNSFNTMVSGIFLGQDTNFRPPESAKHLDAAYYNMRIQPLEFDVKEMTPLEKNFTQTMAFPENSFSSNGAVFSQRRLILLQGNRLFSTHTGQAPALASHARWALHQWTTEDREQFLLHMEKLWDTAQDKCVGLRSHLFTPYSPGTTPFTVRELMAMDELGINWKEYRNDAPHPPKISVEELRKNLQKHLENKQNK